MHPLITVHKAGPIDHIGLGAPDFEAGMNWVARGLGVRPQDLGTYGAQRRGAGWLGPDTFLEVLSPAATDTDLLDPLAATAAALDAPRVLFWYLGVNDFSDYVRHAARAGFPFQMEQHIERDGYDYRIGGLDPVHSPVVPWTVQWVSKPEAMQSWPQLGQITDFRLEHPAPSGVQAILDALEVGMQVAQGEIPRVCVTIRNGDRELALS